MKSKVKDRGTFCGFIFNDVNYREIYFSKEQVIKMICSQQYGSPYVLDIVYKSNKFYSIDRDKRITDLPVVDLVEIKKRLNLISECEFEETRRGRFRETAINVGLIKSGKFLRKFDNITNDSIINKLLYDVSMEVLRHRGGTEYEDMYWISRKSRKVVYKSINAESNPKIDKDNPKHILEVWYEPNVFSIIQNHKDDLITLHNHPNSFPPSSDDFDCNFKYNYGLGIVICHNGDLYVYKASKRLTAVRYNAELEGIRYDLHGNKDVLFDDIEIRRRCIERICSKDSCYKYREL